MLDRDFFVHAFTGTIGGVAGVFVGAPLDTIKVLLQSGHGNYKGIWDCIQGTVQSQGPRALFKGAFTSAVGQVPNNAIVFGSYGSTLAFFERIFPHSSPISPFSSSLSSSSKEEGDSLSSSPTSPSQQQQKHHHCYQNIFSAGSFAGFLQTIALAPLEHIKCQQQVHDWKPGHPRLGIIECGSKLIQSKGVRNGLYRGFWTLAWRDSPTYGLYFCVYEAFKDFFTPPNTTQAPAWVMFNAGGVAGLSAWAVATPFDVVKSIIQGSPIERDTAKTRMLVVARGLYRSEGYKGFFRGLSTSLIRAFPVNAVTFWVYDGLLTRFWSKYHHDDEEAPLT